MRIDVEVGNLDALQRQLDAVFAPRAVNVNAAVGQPGRAAAAAAMTAPRGPAAALRRATVNLQAARAGGSADDIYDAEHAFRRALAAKRRADAAANAQGPSFADRLSQFVRTTRVGGNVSPLVGRGLDLLGLGRFAGPIGIAAAAVTAFAVAVKNGQAAMDAFGQTARQTGGRPGEVAGLGRFGLQSQEASERFYSRIGPGGDPMAQAFAAQMGVDVSGAAAGPMGPQNRAAFLLKAAEGLEKVGAGLPAAQQAEERLRRARVLGIEDALRYVEASDDIKQVLRDQAALQKEIYSEDGTRRANDFAIATESIGTAFTDMTAMATQFAAPALVAGAKGVTEAVQWIMRMSGRGAEVDKEKAKNDAIDRNTSATDALNRTLMNGPGFYGAVGARGQGAISQAWNGYYLDNNLESMRLRKYGIYGL